MVRNRTLLIAAAALLWFAIATSFSAAAPIFGDWSAPVWLGSTVNSASTDQGPALSWDGLSLYFYSSRPGSASDDIWVSQRPSLTGAWGAPVNLGPTINTASREFVPAFSPDGHWMFFASDRPGGFGPTTGTPTADIYQSYRANIHDDLGWQTPTNLGAGVNTEASDNGVGYFDNGGAPQLFFGSDRLGPAGNADLYMSNRQADGSWGPATLIPELSSTATENRPSLREDGLEIFFYSARAGGQGTDLWFATRATVDAAWSTPVNLGTTVNSSATELHPYLSADGRTLVFASARPGGLGGTDLYMTTRNEAPSTEADSASTVQQTPVAIDVLANDSDADGDPLSVTNLTAPTNGTTDLNADDTVTYTADFGFFGTDTFTYTAADGKDAGNVALVTVTVDKKPAKPPKPPKPTNLKP